jgi:hypothetical protein
MYGIKRSDEIVLTVFNHHLNCYEMTLGPDCLQVILTEVNNLERLNKLYELTVDGEQFQWLSLEPGIMIDYILDVICDKYEDWNAGS